MSDFCHSQFTYYMCDPALAGKSSKTTGMKCNHQRIFLDNFPHQLAFDVYYVPERRFILKNMFEWRHEAILPLNI